MEIELRKDNVIKRVDSEDRAKSLESRGFSRTCGRSGTAAKEKISSEAGKKLEDTKKKLKEAVEYAEAADKQISALNLELVGTKEQLEAAVKKNRTSEKK